MEEKQGDGSAFQDLPEAVELALPVWPGSWYAIEGLTRYWRKGNAESICSFPITWANWHSVTRRVEFRS